MGWFWVSFTKNRKEKKVIKSGKNSRVREPKYSLHNVQPIEKHVAKP